MWKGDPSLADLTYIILVRSRYRKFGTGCSCQNPSVRVLVYRGYRAPIVGCFSKQLELTISRYAGSLRVKPELAWYTQIPVNSWFSCPAVSQIYFFKSSTRLLVDIFVEVSFELSLSM